MKPIRLIRLHKLSLKHSYRKLDPYWGYMRAFILEVVDWRIMCKICDGVENGMDDTFKRSIVENIAEEITHANNR